MQGSPRAPPHGGPTWKQFLTAQACSILAVDFVHADTVFLRCIYALIVIEDGPAAFTSSASPRTPTASGRHKRCVSS
jgi:putative transposase